jgi:hypothetical protein
LAVLLDPGALSRSYIGLHLGVTNQFASRCGVPSFFYLFCNLTAAGSEPRLLFVEQFHGMLYELFDGLIGTTLEVLSNQFFQFSAKVDSHSEHSTPT